jgi:hypothetical protein
MGAAAIKEKRKTDQIHIPPKAEISNDSGANASTEQGIKTKKGMKAQRIDLVPPKFRSHMLC